MNKIVPFVLSGDVGYCFLQSDGLKHDIGTTVNLYAD